MTSEGQLISFESLGLELEGRATSKENGQDVSPDSPNSASRLR
jgi:hypothetical protein